MTEWNYPAIGESILTHRLPNGLTICMVPKPEYEMKFAFFATSYGGMDLTWQEEGTQVTTPAGVAHYLEHKMFDTREGNALQTLSANGASANAYTASHMTAYHFECGENFEENLKTLLSFVSVPYFTDESVAKEQGIIGQEIGMLDDNPDWVLFRNLLSSLYLNHPMRHSVSGTVESIAKITAETLYRCHKTFYHPCNMILVVVGNIQNSQSVVDLARSVLPAEPQSPPVRQYGEPEPVEAAQSLCTVEMDVASPNFLVGFKADAPDFGTESLRTALLGELAAELLCGDSSPLYARMYSQGIINKTFGCSFSVAPNAAYLVAGGECKEPETVRQMLLQEAQRLISTPDPEEFRRVRRACYGSRVRALNSFEHIAAQVTQGYFRGYSYFDFGSVYDSIDLPEVLCFLATTVTQERSALSVVTPPSNSDS